MLAAARVRWPKDPNGSCMTGMHGFQLPVQYLTPNDVNQAACCLGCTCNIRRGHGVFILPRARGLPSTDPAKQSGHDAFPTFSRPAACHRLLLRSCWLSCSLLDCPDLAGIGKRPVEGSKMPVCCRALPSARVYTAWAHVLTSKPQANSPPSLSPWRGPFPCHCLFLCPRPCRLCSPCHPCHPCQPCLFHLWTPLR